MEQWVYTYIVLVVILAGAGYSVWRVQRDPNVSFNLLDLLMENGRVSKVSCTFMGSFALSCWLMVDLQWNGKMSEAYFMAFGGMWVAPLIARVIFGKTEAPGTEVKP